MLLPNSLLIMQNAKVTTYITNWLSDYINDHGLQGFVIGISGGVDSAVVSTLCAQTGYPLLCLEMPIHQALDQSSRASDHIDWLKSNYPNVESLSLDLTASFEEMKKTFPKTTNKARQELALANTRARLRMSALYYFAGLESYVVAGTGNKIEDFGIGFYTKYGDGGVDVSPIADLTKTQVYKLAEHLDIIGEILKAKPTDGLFGDSRSDEEQIGATYAELEWAMAEYEKGKTENDFEGRYKEVFQIYAHRHKINQHKWEPIPVCKIPAAYFIKN